MTVFGKNNMTKISSNSSSLPVLGKYTDLIIIPLSTFHIPHFSNKAGVVMDEKYVIKPTKNQLFGRLALIVLIAIPLTALFVFMIIDMLSGTIKPDQIFLLLVSIIFTLGLTVFVITTIVNTVRDLSGKGKRIEVDGDRISVISPKKTAGHYFSEISSVSYDDCTKPEIKYIGLTIHFGNNESYQVIRFEENFDKLLSHLENMKLAERDEDFYKPVKNIKWL